MSQLPVSDNNNRIKCDNCDQYFESTVERDTHANVEHGDGLRPGCSNYVSRTLEDSNQPYFIKEMQAVDRGERLKCCYCDESFISIIEKEGHVLMEHYTFECPLDFCSDRFRTQKEMEEHVEDDHYCDCSESKTLPDVDLDSHEPDCPYYDAYMMKTSGSESSSAGS